MTDRYLGIIQPDSATRVHQTLSPGQKAHVLTQIWDGHVQAAGGISDIFVGRFCLQYQVGQMLSKRNLAPQGTPAL